MASRRTLSSRAFEPPRPRWRDPILRSGRVPHLRTRAPQEDQRRWWRAAHERTRCWTSSRKASGHYPRTWRALPNSALQCLRLSAREESDAHHESSTSAHRRPDLSRPDVAGCCAVRADKPIRATKDNAKQVEAKRPKISVRAQPPVGVAPFRVVLTGELQGGADDFEEYYCPTVEWAWGDDTTSESTLDCEPYEAGKSQIKRRFTVEHHVSTRRRFQGLLSLEAKRQSARLSIGHHSSAAWSPRRELAAEAHSRFRPG